MSIRYFEVFQESDREDEQERYLSSDCTDAITMANADWWGMPEYRRSNLDYLCVERYEVDDDFGEHSNEQVVRTWKPTAEEDFTRTDTLNVKRIMVNVANTYADGEFDAYRDEMLSDNYLGADKADGTGKEYDGLIRETWDRSRQGGNY